MFLPRISPLRTALLILGTIAVSACVHIHNVDDDQMPPLWRAGVTAVTQFRDPSGRYRGAGQVVNSDGALLPTQLSKVFFPGKFGRRQVIDSVELKFDPAGKLTATVQGGSRQLAEATFPAEIESKTGWLLVHPIEVKDTNKFGAVSSTQSARLALSPDGALYVKVRTSGAGIVLFLPAAGTTSVWGRFEPVGEASPATR